MKPNLLILSFCALFVACQAPLLQATPKKKTPSRARTTMRKAPVRKPILRAPIPRTASPRIIAAVPGAPPVAAHRTPATRRALAIEYVKQAAAAYGRGDYRRTIALCQVAADWYPTYARAHIWMGAAYQKLGQTAKAASAYRWGRALAPGTPDAARADRGLKELGYY